MNTRIEADDDKLTDDDGTLLDGRVLRVPMMAMDSAALALHRPGYRYGTDEAAEASERAYREMCERMSNEWRTPQQQQSDQEAACEIARDQVTLNDGRARVDAAYLRMCKQMESSWKS